MGFWRDSPADRERWAAERAKRAEELARGRATAERRKERIAAWLATAEGVAWQKRMDRLSAAYEEKLSQLQNEYRRKRDALLAQRGPQPVPTATHPDALRLKLTDNEYDVLLRRSQGQTFASIGAVYERTGARIRDIEQKALRKMRHPARQSLLLPGDAWLVEFRQRREA